MSYAFRGQALPEDLEESLTAYVETGRPTGGFLEACITNNLRGAVSHADERNLPMIGVVVGWLYNVAPAGCWGKPDSFERWITMHHTEREKAVAR